MLVSHPFAWLFGIAICLCAVYASAQPDIVPDEESDSPWTLSLSERFLSRDYKYGVDMSDNVPTLGTTARVEHDIGLEGSAGFSHLLGGVGGLQRWFVAGAYTQEFSDHFSADAELTHYGYSNDSLNILAGLDNQFAVSLNGTFSPVSLSLTYDHYFGATPADFLGADIFGIIHDKPWTYIIGANATYMSEQVPVNLLKTKKDKKGVVGAIATQVVSGFSNASVTFIAVRKFGGGFSGSISPTVIYSPQSDVITQSLNVTLAVGLTYSISP